MVDDSFVKSTHERTRYCVSSGFGYAEDQHFFNWQVDYKGHITDVTLDETIIPILKQQGIVSKLGMHY